MEHQQIFATNIFLIDDFIPMSTEYERSIMLGMKHHISDLWKERDYDNNWQTKSADLHKKKEFEHFTKLIIKTGKDICDTLGYDVKDLIITINNNNHWLSDFCIWLLFFLKLLGYEIKYNYENNKRYFNLQSLNFEDKFSSVSSSNTSISFFFNKLYIFSAFA